ncbi:alpha/beta hydrolase [Ensifer sp. ENS05]|uniref:alpha/beta fold hydrolase n=1 Tax=Ensifer sp. ENS05 TaxID=2769277 RepID=UPI00177DE526|nr:alpha/beta hydrolase [Ensifer sp. ENS05]MBD9596380.1 alpha/beta hydrolase [Ensifer sp. ENS05]
METEFSRTTLDLKIGDVEVQIAAIHRKGVGAPIVFLHGFGSTKEDYADITRYAAFGGRAFLAYDAPGCGESVCSDLSRVSIPFLVETAFAVLDHLGIQKFHIVGHSMGGLTALLLADRDTARVLSFVDIEGNIAPEDCFLSRQVFEYGDENAERFLADFVERARHAPAHSSALYAASLHHKVRADAVRSIFQSMVDLSDHGNLMTRFLGLPCPRMFMYGEENASLSYLDDIAQRGVELAEIPYCGHFPMYSNPPEMWRRIGSFLRLTAAYDQNPATQRLS